MGTIAGGGIDGAPEGGLDGGMAIEGCTAAPQ
jgi:hypothetical protein